MGTKNNPGKFDCYAAAEPDEPMFVLLGRDPVAGSLVRAWVRVRRVLGWGKPEKMTEALECADAMDEWARRDPDVAPDVDRAVHVTSLDFKPSELDTTIGKLDRVLSEFLAHRKRLASLDEPDRQTLKHHAEDMQGAGEAMLAALGHGAIKVETNHPGEFPTPRVRVEVVDLGEGQALIVSGGRLTDSALASLDAFFAHDQGAGQLAVLEVDPLSGERWVYKKVDGRIVEAHEDEFSPADVPRGWKRACAEASAYGRDLLDQPRVSIGDGYIRVHGAHGPAAILTLDAAKRYREELDGVIGILEAHLAKESEDDDRK